MPETRTYPRRWDVSTAALVVANAFPIAGVLFLHWQVFPLILVYWLENVVVGFFNVLRMAFAVPEDAARWVGKFFLIPFFCFHYGMFTYVHGIFVFALFGGKSAGTSFDVPSALFQTIQGTGIGFAVLAMVLSHGISFVVNYLGGGEYQRVSLQQLMAQPYSRIVVLHMAILGGGFATMALGSPVYALIVLATLKTGIDLAAHRAERRKLGEPGEPKVGAIAA